MFRSVRSLSKFTVVVVFCVAAALDASAQTAPATPATALTQGFSCPVAKAPVVAAAAPAAPALPVPAPQTVAKPADYEASRSFPRWSDFPPPPKDIPKPAEFAARVASLGQVRESFSLSVKGLDWDANEPDALQKAALARLDPAYMSPIETMTCEQYAEFARSKQKLATPPPIADN